MIAHCHVHIVDSDCARRATLARQVYGLGIHVEIYESLEELIETDPRGGSVLINMDHLPLDEEAAIERLASCTSHLPTAFYSANPCSDRIVTAVLAGALDYLQWPSAPEVLAFKLDRLARSGGERVAACRQKREALRMIGRLSPRERDVLGGVVAGGSNKEIGRWLGISPRTVEIHRGNMMARLSARSLAHAVRIGIQAGLADEAMDRTAPPPLFEMAMAA